MPASYGHAATKTPVIPVTGRHPAIAREVFSYGLASSLHPARPVDAFLVSSLHPARLVDAFWENRGLEAWRTRGAFADDRQPDSAQSK